MLTLKNFLRMIFEDYNDNQNQQNQISAFVLGQALERWAKGEGSLPSWLNCHSLVPPVQIQADQEGRLWWRHSVRSLSDYNSKAFKRDIDGMMANLNCLHMPAVVNGAGKKWAVLNEIYCKCEVCVSRIQNQAYISDSDNLEKNRLLQKMAECQQEGNVWAAVANLNPIPNISSIELATDCLIFL